MTRSVTCTHPSTVPPHQARGIDQVSYLYPPLHSTTPPSKGHWPGQLPVPTPPQYHPTKQGALTRSVTCTHPSTVPPHLARGIDQVSYLYPPLHSTTPPSKGHWPGQLPVPTPPQYHPTKQGALTRSVTCTHPSTVPPHQARGIDQVSYLYPPLHSTTPPSKGHWPGQLPVPTPPQYHPTKQGALTRSVTCTHPSTVPPHLARGIDQVSYLYPPLHSTTPPSKGHWPGQLPVPTPPQYHPTKQGALTRSVTCTHPSTVPPHLARGIDRVSYLYPPLRSTTSPSKGCWPGQLPLPTPPQYHPTKQGALTRSVTCTHPSTVPPHQARGIDQVSYLYPPLHSTTPPSKGHWPGQLPVPTPPQYHPTKQGALTRSVTCTHPSTVPPHQARGIDQVSYLYPPLHSTTPPSKGHWPGQLPVPTPPQYHPT